MIIKLDIPPGVYRNATEYQAQARWYDTNLVRWVDGLMSPVGGWQLFSLSPVVGIPRGLFSWRDNSGYRWLAVGTNEKLYAHDEGDLHDITPAGFTTGLGGSVIGYGYGAGPYGAGTYGTQRTIPSSLVLDAATWSLDSWGEHLVACCSADGKIYEWSLDTATPAVVVSNAPTNNLGVFVSDQRHLVAVGAGGDGRKVQWSDSENNTVWTPSSTNQAGDFLLNTSGEIRCAVKTAGETLLLTSSDAHAMRYIGYPYIFSFSRVGTNCGISGPNAAVSVDGGVAYLGNDARLYLYNGTINNIPCDVEDWLETEFDKTRQAEVYGGGLSEHGEVWWFFPANDGGTKYVVWNYRLNVFYIGTLDRTAWLDRGVWKFPVGASSDGYLYQHEHGDTDSGTTRVGDVYAESGAMEIGDGNNVFDVNQVIPDESTRGAVSVTLKCRYTPTGTETTYGPYVVRSDGYTDTRASGRHARLRIDAVEDSDWRVGIMRADIVPGGSR